MDSPEETSMKGKRFSEERTIAILKEAETGAATTELCRRRGTSQPTFRRRKARYGGMEISDAKTLRAPEDENWWLKRDVTEQAPEIATPQEGAGRTLATPAAKRKAACVRVTGFRRSVVRSCSLVGLQRSTFQ